MKKNIKIFLIIILSTMMLQSCLHDQEDTFDKASSLRLAEFNQQVAETLKSAQYGWYFEIFPGNTQAYGGYTFTCQFDGMNVTVGAESPLPGNKEVTGFETSLYKVTNDNGSTLIFDTYNPIMHYLAESTSALYRAYGGDNEYVVDSLGTDVIKLHGARSKSTAYMYKLTQPADKYLESLQEFSTNYWNPAIGYYTCVTMEINGEKLTGEVLNNRMMEYSINGGEKKTIPLAYYNNGLRFYKPITVGGVSFRDLSYNFENHTYSTVSQDGMSYQIEGTFPEWVINYDKWAGEYEMYIRSTSVTGDITTLNVELVPTPARDKYLLRGVNDTYDLELTYDKNTNVLTLRPQVVGKPLTNGHIVLLAGWDAEKGYVHYGLHTTSLATGMRLYWSEANQIYKWIDNGVWSTYKITAYILYEFNGTTRVGAISLTDTEQSAYAINNSGRIYAMEGLKRK